MKKFIITLLIGLTAPFIIVWVFDLVFIPLEQWIVEHTISFEDGETFNVKDKYVGFVFLQAISVFGAFAYTYDEEDEDEKM